MSDVVFSPRNRYLATRGEFETGMSFATTDVWDLHSHQRVCTLEAHASRMTFSPDESLLATANVDVDADQKVHYDVSVWDVKTGAEQMRLQPRGSTLNIGFLSNTELVTTSNFDYDSGRNARVFVWDIADKR